MGDHSLYGSRSSTLEEPAFAAFTDKFRKAGVIPVLPSTVAWVFSCPIQLQKKTPEKTCQVRSGVGRPIVQIKAMIKLLEEVNGKKARSAVNPKDRETGWS